LPNKSVRYKRYKSPCAGLPIGDASLKTDHLPFRFSHLQPEFPSITREESMVLKKPTLLYLRRPRLILLPAHGIHDTSPVRAGDALHGVALPA
jgi:hypothetical protein